MSTNYQRPEDNQGVNDVSRISAGSTVKGEISSPYNVRIDGNFEGRIVSQSKVVIGEKAIIKGDIICNNIDIWGNVQGDLYVQDTLALKETCVVEGDLHIRRLAVELDATFNGNCKMITEEEFAQLTSGNSLRCIQLKRRNLCRRTLSPSLHPLHSRFLQPAIFLKLKTSLTSSFSL